MKSIEVLRKEIDGIHEQIHSLLCHRRDLTLQVWEQKVEQGLPYFNAQREQQIIEHFLNLESKKGQDPEFDLLLENVMNSILREYEKYLRAKFPEEK